MTLTTALDKDTAVVVERLLSNGVRADTALLYQAIQRSNSSLKRRPKKVLEDSIDRVLDHLNISDGDDSEATAEQEVIKDYDADIMNKALRQSMAAQQLRAPSPPPQPSPARKRKTNGEALPKRQKTDLDPPTEVTLSDLGGMDSVMEQFEDALVFPLSRPSVYAQLKLALPRGILLHGPPGCGKTAITKAYASLLGVPFIQVLGPSIVSGMSGESEKGIREKFDEAKKNAPALLFIDEIDAIAPKRESSQSQMEKRIVAQLLLSMDSLGESPDKPVIVLAATNRPDSLDPALRRGGRFDTEICIGVPDEAARAKILAAQTREKPLAPDVDLALLAKRTAGFVGADLQTLVSKAGAWQLSALKGALLHQARELQGNMDVASTTEGQFQSRAESLVWSGQQRDLPMPSGFEDIALTMQAFLSVLPSIIPSSKREGFATIPNVSWNDIGALTTVRKELEMAIVEPIVNPARFARFGISAPTGVLLCGPPGCGKTLLAKAVAAESRANFISVKGPELLDKYLGESEAAVRRVFSRARASAPCIVFFDELDALTPRRDGSSSEASARVVNMLLTELDGMNERGDVFVVGATNRPDIIDDAMMRPGRLETILFIDLPGPSERADILKTIIRGKNVAPELADLAASPLCDGFTGADLRALWRKAAQHALERDGDAVSKEDFEAALGGMQKSVLDAGRYEAMKKRFTKRG